MTGAEKILEVCLRVNSEEEAMAFVDRFSPGGGWAVEERDGRLFLRMYFEGRTPADLPSEAEVKEAPNWEDRFRESFKGIEVGSFFVRPPWIGKREDLVDVVIHPGSGFGTGDHPSTQGVLKLLLDEERLPSEVLDVGCGSGILSIASCRLGAGKAFAVDIDPLAISNAKENVRLNSLEEKIFLVVGSASCVGRNFTLVMANLDFFTLVYLRDTMFGLVAEGGSLIISGFIEEDESTIVDLYRSVGFCPSKRIELNRWVSLLLKKTGVKA